MNKIFFALFAMIITALPAMAAPGNTTGPWGIDAAGFKNLSTALASPATVGKTVVVTKPMSINNKTVSGNRTVRVLNGGRISVAVGKVFLFAADSDLEAENTVFDGQGLVSGLKVACPEYWGGKPDNLDSSAAVNTAALRSAWNSGAPVLLKNGTYKFVGPLNCNTDNFHLKGQGKFKTILQNVGIGGENALVFNSDYIEISDLTILGSSASGNGIVFGPSSAGYVGKHIDIVECLLKYHGGHGITWTGGEGTRYSSYINLDHVWLASNSLNAIYSDSSQTINTFTMNGCVVNGGASYIANMSQGLYIGRGQTVTVLGSSFQSFVYGINYGYDGASSGFLSKGNYFEGFTEAGINIGGVVAGRTVSGFDISGDYYNLNSITNAAEGAGIRISKGFGSIGPISVLNYSASKKLIVTLTGETTVTNLNDTYSPYCSFIVGTKIIYTGLGQTMILDGTHITGWTEDQKTANRYAQGTSNYYFTIPAKYNDYVTAVKAFFSTDNVDATATFTVYKQNLADGSAKVQLATGGRTGNGLFSKDINYRVESGYALVLKVTIVDDGAGGSYTYLYAPYVTGTY